MRIAHLALAGAMALAPLAPLPLISTAQAQQRAPESFAPLARELLPAVVNISTSKNVAPRGGRPNAPEMPQLPPGSPFEEFFRDFFNRNRPPGQGQGEGPPILSRASGVSARLAKARRMKPGAMA